MGRLNRKVMALPSRHAETRLRMRSFKEGLGFIIHKAGKPQDVTGCGGGSLLGIGSPASFSSTPSWRRSCRWAARSCWIWSH
jgi:hypothetical protein